MSKYTEAIEFLEHLEGKDLEFSWTDSGITELLKARDLAVETLEIADRLEQAEEELKDEYNSMNDWYINKFDIFQDHTECEKIALDFTLSTMQTISYLLDALADIRGDNNDGV